MKAEEMRNSGIEVIGRVPWGTHFCQFYQTKEDLIDILVPYFKEGLEKNEFCMWVTSEPLNAEEAKQALARAVPDLDQRMARGQIEILPYSEWYVLHGVFDQQRVLQGWVDKLRQAQKKGYEGLRLTGNTFWLEKADWQDFTNYEEAVNSVIGKYPMMALCTYCMDKCNASEVIDVVRNHQFALLKREGDWTLIESSERKRAEEAILKLNTELTAAVAELETANVKLQELDRLKSLFISSMSHELRTPLTTIIGFTGILLKGMAGELNPEQDRQLRMVQQSADHLLALINDIIDISKIEAGKAELAVGDFDLVALVREQAAAMAVPLCAKGLSLSIAAPDTLVIEGDQRRMRQILVNLLGNAIKFTDHGGIEVRVANRGNEVDLVVRDTGIGIGHEDIDKLFVPFSQIVVSGRAKEGSGLGLYVSQRLARLMGGSIQVASEPGQGSTFTVSVPAFIQRKAS